MSLRRWLSWAGVATLVAVALFVGTRPTGPSGDDDRAVAIAEGLRCPVCQGLSVADSDSETARSIRSDIAGRIAEGQTDGDIRQAYVERYGEWILLRPRGEGLGTVVWVVPIAAVLVAGTAIVVVGHRGRRLDPTNPEALAYSGWILALAGISDPRAGTTDAGLERIDQAIAADPSYPDAHVFRGMTLLNTGDPAGAVPELERYLQLAPDGPLRAQVDATLGEARGQVQAESP